ncbi:MAG TPA: hypothetical protein VGF52_00475 [Tepidisphaeraceae bacterium]
MRNPKKILLQPCRSADDLHRWIRLFTGLRIPRRAVCANHQAPFDYLCRAYFEPTVDQVVWAPRGGGKTRLAALATLLDLLHKPCCAVRILGGSLEQSLRMWEHLQPDLEHLAKDLFVKKTRPSRQVALNIGSSAAVLTQSERAVRGLRVQKLRCDEVELFKPEIWQAAQLVTRSIENPRQTIAGSIEAISTFHRLHGLMHQIIEQAEAAKTPIVRWCLLEVLEKCPPARDCKTCPLWDDCRGIAKTACDGFVRIDDAIAMKHRVSAETWESEMLCKRPSVQSCVFPSFDPAIHVKEISQTTEPITLAIDFGFHAPLVCLWITDDGNSCNVIDEYVQPQRTMAEHVQQIESRSWKNAKRVACDPAGAGRNDQTAESNIQFLRRQSFRVHSKRSLIVEGLELIRAALKPAAGSPTLFVHPRCKHLINAMQHYRYPDGGGELPIKDGTHDHLIDALRYFFINRPTPLDAPRRY